MKTYSIGNITLGQNAPLFLISGPCVIESEDLMMHTAEALVRITSKLEIPFIFKSSYEKDNRSNETNYRGPGIEKGLRILEKIKKTFNVPVISDVHRESDLQRAKEVLDIIQIPAFLCQQTSLLLSAGKTGLPVNVKKGQFMSAEAMKGAISKIQSTGNGRIMLTERGTFFGYNNLVNDFTCIPKMQKLGCPVIYDATHSVRHYGIPSKDPKGGSPEFVPPLVKAGVAAGCDGLFMEIHPNPREALCDASSQFTLSQSEALLKEAVQISRIVRRFDRSDEKASNG